MNLTIINKPINGLEETEKEQMLFLLKKYFTDPTSLFQRELEKNNQTLMCLINNNLAGFFMTGWEKGVLMKAKTTTLIFLGLSCTDPSYREINVGKILYSEFFTNAAKHEAAHQQSMTYWFTTASPLILLASKKYVDVKAPTGKSELTKEDIETLNFIKERYSLKQYDDREYPFILRSSAEDTQYTASYSEYLDAIQRDMKTDLFENYEIEESRGDRFLFYAVNHAEQQLLKVSKEYEHLKLKFSSITH